MHQRILLVIIAVLLANGCSPGGSNQPAGELTADGPGLIPPVAPLAASVPETIAEQIRSVSEAPVPAEVDPVIFEELRSQLIRVLATKSVAIPPPGAVPPPPLSTPRTASFTPYGVANAVQDLVVTDADPPRLSWTYRNKGDYDLNGMVNVSDLTPVGSYYGMSSSDPMWLKAAAADGDGNGMITVSDITPIGQGFGATITGYQVWGAEEQDGEWSYIGGTTVEVNLSKNPIRPRFVVNLPSLDYNYYSLWPYDGSDDEGWWSNIAYPGQPEQRYAINQENIWQPES